MKSLPAIALMVALGFGSAALLHAQDAPAEKPAEKKVVKSTKAPRLTKPWADMETFTLEQKQQIAAIHKTALADKKKVEAKEMEDITALLTPEQKTELEKVTEETAAGKKKAKSAGVADKTEETPSTQPAEGGM